MERASRPFTFAWPSLEAAAGTPVIALHVLKRLPDAVFPYPANLPRLPRNPAAATLRPTVQSYVINVFGDAACRRWFNSTSNLHRVFTETTTPGFNVRFPAANSPSEGRPADVLPSETTFLRMMQSFRWNWQKVFSYGEVVCFVSAWAIGLVIAVQGQRTSSDRIARPDFTTTPDVFGMQATLRR